MSDAGRAPSSGSGDRRYPPIAESPLFFLDYDGTLAEITEDPAQAHPHPELPNLLGRLAGTSPVYLLTGRSVRDLARLVHVPEVHVIGVHGLEQGVLTGGGEARDVRSRLGEEESRLLDHLRSHLPEVQGIRVEDKGSAIALHYRGVRDPERVEAELRGWTETLPAQVDVVRGKMLVEVRPRGFDKGRAALETARGHPGTTPVVVGDDTTDEDAFRLLTEGVTVKVGEGGSAARYRLASVDEVIGYLKRYLR